MNGTIPDPSDLGRIDLTAGGLTDATHQIIFANGAPTYIGEMKNAPVEAALNIPVNVLAGTMDSFFSVLPLRLYFDIRRGQAKDILRNDGTTVDFGEALTQLTPAYNDVKFTALSINDTVKKGETMDEQTLSIPIYSVAPSASVSSSEQEESSDEEPPKTSVTDPK